METPFFTVEVLFEQRDPSSLVSRASRWDTGRVTSRVAAEVGMADLLTSYEGAGYLVRRGLGRGTAASAADTYTFSVERRTSEQAREAYDAQEAAEAQADAEWDAHVNA